MVIKPKSGSPSPIPKKGKLTESVTEMVSNETSATPDAPDAMTPRDGAGASVASHDTQNQEFPDNLPEKLGLILAQDGRAFAVMRDAHNDYALPVGCKWLNNIIRKIGREEGRKLRKSEITEINEHLQAHAEMAGKVRNVWYRVAPITNGIVIDLGDEKHTHVRVTAGKVEFITEGSESLFYRTHLSRPFAKPAEEGDFSLLRKHLNIHPIEATIFIAWLS